MTYSRLSGRVAGAVLGAVLAAPFLAVQPAAAEDSIVIRDFVLTHGIYAREPVGTTESFAPSDGRGYAFARIANDGSPTEVSFVWYRGEDKHASIDTTIGTSSGWRTWSSINLQPGQWRVTLQDAGGQLIAERAFTVEPDSATSAGAGTSEQSIDTSSYDGRGGELDDGWHGPHDGG
jgi:hypothetical protein